MCGIGGILRVSPPGEAAPALARPAQESIPEAWLDVLDEAIRHRGPDGHGRFRDRALRADGSVVEVALVHRRLSILDHAGGAQPMVAGVARVSDAVAPDPSAPTSAPWPAPMLFHGRPGDPVVYRSVVGEAGPRGSGGCAPGDLVAVVFNGCIYNHRELRADLRAAGHEFVTDHSDTEVLVHGWREWGEDLPARLEGMFSFVVWDRATARLFAARDPAGEKPLYESDLDGLYSFASVPAALARLLSCGAGVPGAARGGRPAVSMRGLREWLRFGATCWSPFDGIDEVEGRVRAIYDRHDRGDGAMVNGMRRGWYDTWPRRGEGRLDADRVEALLSEAVRSRLEADVPLGCFLSGGTDSSLIALMLRRYAGRARTFCVRMPDERFDESEIARRVAALLGADHTTLDCAARPAEDLVALIHQLGLPFGDSSLLPAHWVSRAARSVTTVALSGDGGDELFGGYERHVANRWLRRWRLLLRALPPTAGRGAHPRSALAKAARLAGAARRGYAELLAVFQADDLARLLPGPEPAPTLPGPCPDPLRFDFEWYLPFDLLRKTDTASMAVALEVRAPMLARPLVRAALAAPLDDLMPRGRGGGRKGLLRQVARRHLPAEIVDRPKMGFAIPIGEWFRTDYGGLRTLLYDRLTAREPFGPDSLGINSAIDPGFVRRMLREHDQAGSRSPWPWKGRDHSQRLYVLLVLSIWADWLAGAQRQGGAAARPAGG
jgi:asparagine synthase (glutamine-hydrolysing)